MKKLLAFAISSLATMALATGQAAAWCCHHNCCCSATCNVTISGHQYNAFSPVCFDGLNVKGCCPMPFNNAPPPPQPTYCCPPSCCDGNDCSYLGQLPAPGTIRTPPANATPAPSPTYQGPMPTPAGNQQSMNPMAPMQIYPQVSVQPYGQTAYYPANYPNAPMMPAPYGGPMMGGR